METTTLKNLISENNPYGISGITIPRIQRAYAQGRSDAHAVKTRERFLSAIHAGLTKQWFNPSISFMVIFRMVS